MPRMWRCWASLSKMPGKRLLMVTLRAATCRASPAAKPTRPARAPFDRPSSPCGILTLRDTMLTMRPKPRAAMPSSVSRIISIGPSIMSSSAAIQSCRDQVRKSPGSGPCELVIRMSGAGHAAIAASRPAAVVRSAATAETFTAVACAMAAPLCSKTSRVRATMTRLTPSRASASAHALPRPRLAPHTSAVLPAIPRFIRRGRLRSRRDRGQWLELVAVALVELERGGDAQALGERLGIETGQRLAQIAAWHAERLHQRFHRDRIDGRIGGVQKRQQPQIFGAEIFSVGIARPRRGDDGQLGRRDVAGHVGGAVATQTHDRHHQAEIGAVAAHDRDVRLAGQHLRDLADPRRRFLVNYVVRMLEDA